MPIRIVKRTTAPVVPKTIAEVIGALDQKSALERVRRRDMISACNSFARLVGKHAQDISSDVMTLRHLLSKLHHMQGQMTRKRLANIRADLIAALQATGVLPPLDSNCPISVAWQEFLSKATANHQAWGLARFARFCSARQVDPAAVTDDVLKAFERRLDISVITNEPARIARDTAKNFNVIIRRNGLDMDLLCTKRGERYTTLPLSTYPPSLQADIAKYLKRLEKPGLFSDDGPRRALRPVSLRNIEAHLRQTLDAAVSAGHAREKFKTLADLIDLDVLNGAAHQITKRSAERTPTSLPNILGTLLAIARYYVQADAKTIKIIASAKAKVSDQLGGGQRSMSPKSQRRMEQFRDDENVCRIIELPDRLIRRADRSPVTQAAAMDAMIAASIAFLLACPALRMKNLATLNLDEDLSRETKGRLVAFVVHIATQKTKGRQAVDAIIEAPFSTIIDRYLKQYRHRFSNQAGHWVFPRRSGGPRTPNELGKIIKKKIFDETGIVMHPHLFRHLSGLLFLEQHPGEYESVRRLVGHAKIETTTSFYAPQSSRAAFERYGQVLNRFRRDRQ